MAKKTSNKKKTGYASYKTRNVAGKNKERKLLAHMARHPNDKVAEVAVDAASNVVRKPSRAKKSEDAFALQLAKADKKLYNLKAHSTNSKGKKERYIRPDSAFKVAFKIALQRAGI